MSKDKGKNLAKSRTKATTKVKKVTKGKNNNDNSHENSVTPHGQISPHYLQAYLNSANLTMGTNFLNVPMGTAQVPPPFIQHGNTEMIKTASIPPSGPNASAYSIEASVNPHAQSVPPNYFMPPQFAHSTQPIIKHEDGLDAQIMSNTSIDKSETQSQTGTPNDLEVSFPSISSGNASISGKDKFNEEGLTEDEIKARKKAQNRAAQKAFRERKEARLKELENKLSDIEKNRDLLVNELEDLRRLNMEINEENRILLRKGDTVYKLEPNEVAENGKFSFPSEDEFFAQVVLGKYNAEGAKHSNDFEDDANKLLTVPKTWSYLHRLSEEKNFDVLCLMERLKGLEVSHKNGPAYYKNVIDTLVEEACLEN